MGELYGEVNKLTLEWRDGLMAAIVRQCVKDTTEDHKWIVCDGPVDALWIENMNTVLDDNKMLCMANSERIKLTPSMHMMFEVQDLAVASPATVSRCGMVYLDPGDLGWRPYVQTWMTRQMPTKMTTASRDYMLGLFDTYINPGLKFLRKQTVQTVTQVSEGDLQISAYEMCLTGVRGVFRDVRNVLLLPLRVSWAECRLSALSFSLSSLVPRATWTSPWHPISSTP